MSERLWRWIFTGLAVLRLPTFFDDWRSALMAGVALGFWLALASGTKKRGPNDNT